MHSPFIAFSHSTFSVGTHDTLLECVHKKPTANFSICALFSLQMNRARSEEILIGALRSQNNLSHNNRYITRSCDCGRVVAEAERQLAFFYLFPIHCMWAPNRSMHCLRKQSACAFRHFRWEWGWLSYLRGSIKYTFRCSIHTSRCWIRRITRMRLEYTGSNNENGLVYPSITLVERTGYENVPDCTHSNCVRMDLASHGRRTALKPTHASTNSHYGRRKSTDNRPICPHHKRARLKSHPRRSL